MSNAEAAKELVKLYAEYRKSCGVSDKYAEAVALAISALSKGGEGNG